MNTEKMANQMTPCTLPISMTWGKCISLRRSPLAAPRWWERLITEVLDELQDGDALIVAELSRLGRNILECMDIMALAFDHIKLYGAIVSFV